MCVNAEVVTFFLERRCSVGKGRHCNVGATANFLNRIPG
jgi:hypothetical protein